MKNNQCIGSKKNGMLLIFVKTFLSQFLSQFSSQFLSQFCCLLYDTAKFVNIEQKLNLRSLKK